MSLLKARDLVTMRSITIRYTGILASFDDPATAAIALAPELAAKREKIARRRAQRNGNREPTGRAKGRPRQTEAQAIESAERRRAYMREHMREKRALAKFWGAGFKTAWPEDRTSTGKGQGQP